MARIRSVHPSLFTDDGWVSCSPLARILYIALWTDADDQGVFEWKPLQIKMRLLPGDMAEVGPLLDELVGVDLITSFSAEGRPFGAIKSFRKFQRPQKPNAIHPLPVPMREYVGLSKPDVDQVADQYDTGTVISPQMEDGGWRIVEEGIKKEREREIFDEALEAFPESGRQVTDVPLARTHWDAAADEIGEETLLEAVRAFAAAPVPRKRDLVPSMNRWLSGKRYLAFLAQPDAPQRSASAWAGPADLRAAVAAEAGEGMAASYIDPAAWEDGVIIARTDYGAERLRALISLRGVEIHVSKKRAA